MNPLRMVPATGSAVVPCCRCDQGDHLWDRIGGKAYCPSCQESLVQGESPPLLEPTVKNRCAVCNRQGTVAFLTYPHNGQRPLEMDLCSDHLRDLIGRRLSAHSFHQLRRQLLQLGLSAEDIFLLHNEFYNRNGKALRPADEPDPD